MKLSTVWLDGLWDRNPGLIQLLGLCPLLAVSNTLENAIGLGLATLFVPTPTDTKKHEFTIFALPFEITVRAKDADDMFEWVKALQDMSNS